MLDRLLDYSRKLRILRQIMSNKAKVYGRINAAVNLSTVFVSSLLTFAGFAGLAKLKLYVSWFAPVDEQQVEFAFNLSVFTLFVLVILHLVFRFADRQAEASRAIVSLTHLVNGIDDIIAKAEQGYQVSSADVELVRQKYDTLIQVIPANSDAEYLRARKDFTEKETRKMTLQLAARDLFDEGVHGRAVEALIRSSPLIMSVLETLRQTDPRLYLGGGVIRNAVWDYLHGYSATTTSDDVDVVYFDRTCALKVHDEVIEQKLHAVAPNVRWSVKNQARMHVVNNEPEYVSVEDAIGKWPETATAMIARLHIDGTIEIVAPHRFGDLFRLIVQPTAHFHTRLKEYRDRLDRKKWEANWPKLKFLDRQ